MPPRGRVRRARGLVHARARGRGAGAPGRPDRGLQRRGGAAGDAGLAGRCTRRCSATTRSAQRRWLNQPNPLEPGAARPAAARRFLERYGERVSGEHRGALPSSCRPERRRLVAERPPAAARPGARRLPAGQPPVRRAGAPRALTVVDWQTVGWGPAMLDAVLLPRLGLAAEVRRAHEHELLRVLPRRADRARRQRVQLGAAAGRSTGAWCFHGLVMADRGVDDRRTHATAGTRCS